MRGVELLTAIFAIAVAGCDSTVFESPPGRQTAACDQRWVGNWEVVDRDSKAADDKSYLVVDPDCNAIKMIEHGELQKEPQIGKIYFATIARESILAVAIEHDASQAPSGDPEWDRGYYYFSYRVRAEGIAIRMVDDQRVTDLMLARKLFGRTEIISRRPGSKHPSGGPQLNNFVAGDADDMARIVRDLALFKRQDAFVLKRIDHAPSYTVPTQSGAEHGR